jgi:hypothetical protein
VSDLAARLHGAIDDCDAVGWGDAYTSDLRADDVHAAIDAALATATVKVYVVERGVYSDRYVEGAYGSLEAAQAANPGTAWEESEYGGWRRWMNELDWDSAVSISEHDVPIVAIPVASPAEAPSSTHE